MNSPPGYDYHPQVGTAGFFVDIGVVDPKDGQRYILGVECDGAAYHSSGYARDRDRLRQMILEKRGWKLHRIWSTDWFYRREREIAKLKDAIAAALAGRSVPAAANVYDFEPFKQIDLPLAEVGGISAIPDVNDDSEGREAAEGWAGLRPYEFAGFRVYRHEPHKFDDGQLADIVKRIVNIERPIHEEEVARRLAKVCGLQRAGGRIQTAAMRGLTYARREGSLTSELHFWSESGASEVDPRSRAELAPAEMVRKPAMVSGRALAAAAVIALRQNLAMYYDELVSETARLIGWERVGDDVAKAIAGAIDNYLIADLDEDHLGRVKLK